MEAVTKLCSQKLKLTSSVLIAIVILIICHAQFSSVTEPIDHNVEADEGYTRKHKL